MTKRDSKSMKVGTLVEVKSGDSEVIKGIYQGANASCIGKVKIATGEIIERPLGQIKKVKEGE